EPERLVHRIFAVLDAPRRCVGGVGGDIGTAGRAVGVAPAVILALELLPLVDADGEAHAAVQAAVLPDIDVAVIGAPHGQLAAEQLALIDVTEGQIRAGSDGIPGGVGKR